MQKEKLKAHQDLGSQSWKCKSGDTTQDKDAALAINPPAAQRGRGDCRGRGGGGVYTLPVFGLRSRQLKGVSAERGAGLPNNQGPG